MHQYKIWPCLVEHISHTGQDSGCHVIEILPLFHDVKVVVRSDVENLQHLVQHLAVLAGYTDSGLELVWMFLKLLHQRGHLYRLRSGAEYKHYVFHMLVYLNFLITSHRANLTR